MYCDVDQIMLLGNKIYYTAHTHTPSVSCYTNAAAHRSLIVCTEL